MTAKFPSAEMVGSVQKLLLPDFATAWTTFAQ